MWFQNPSFDHFKIAKGTLVPSILWLVCLRHPKSVISMKDCYRSGRQMTGVFRCIERHLTLQRAKAFSYGWKVDIAGLCCCQTGSEPSL